MRWNGGEVNDVQHFPPSDSNLLALGIGGLLGGAAAVETVFTWPGMGLYIVDAVGARDLPVVQGFAVISAGIFILCNLGADLLAMTVDPRLRHQVQL